jgi:hypothetical protein
MCQLGLFLVYPYSVRVECALRFYHLNDRETQHDPVYDMLIVSSEDFLCLSPF